MILRIRIVVLVFILLIISLIVRLFYWQLIKSGDLTKLAKKQFQGEELIETTRGEIYSQDGSLLVSKGVSWTIFLDKPNFKGEENQLADKLAPLFLKEEDFTSRNYQKELLNEASNIKTLINKENLVWIPLKKRLSDDIKKNIESLGIEGLGFESEEIRNYPEASMAAHLIGFLGKNTEGKNTGYFGLEGFYDLILSGKPGFSSREFDAKGIPIPIGEINEVMAKKGINLVTFIDKGIQLSVEKKLKEGIEKYQALGGSVIVMKPKDGGILAMSSYPSYDPGKYWDYDQNLYKNPAVSDAFEPGSIFKVLIMSSALDANVVEPETKCDICSGPLKVDKYTIETWDKKYFPDETMTEVIIHSDNVGMSFVGQKLGADKLYDYLDSYGIGKLSGIDLQGEANPGLRKKGTWNIVDLATASFGQGVAVTPIQMVRAVGAIANKGVIISPRIVNKLTSDNWEEEIKLQKGERVISEKAANEMTNMMVEAAKSGESKWTYLKGFRVAGKTGTAQIPIAGHYDEKRTNASFVGFAPAENPKFAMLVILREPKSSQWASETAAPLWYNIAKDLFLYFGIQPEG